MEVKICKNCKYFNTFGTDNFHGICDKNGNLADEQHTCLDYTEHKINEKSKV